MKIALISDIHGNYDALKEVFKEIDKLKIKEVYCLGDIVNYYYEPDKCINLLIKKKVKCIKGNHEKIFLKSLKNKTLRNFFASRYGNSIHINHEKIKKKHLNFIKSLPKFSELDADWVDKLRQELPELPDAKKTRFIKNYNLSIDDSGVLVGDRQTADYFELVASGRDGKLAANWVTGELFRALNSASLSIADSPVAAQQLGRLLDLLSENIISRTIAKKVFEIMFVSGADADQVIAEQGLRQVSDSDAIADVVDKILADNPDKVDEYQAGKDKLMGWFVGQVMKLTQGKANPQTVNNILKEKLKE